MINAQCRQFGVGLAPISTNSGAITPLPFDTSGGTTGSPGAYATCVLTFGVVGGAATVCKITECDTSGGSYTDVSGAVQVGTTGDGRLPQTTDAGKQFVFYIPLGGRRKKFLQLEMTTGATTLSCVAWDLTLLNIMPSTNTQAGATARIFANAS